MTKYKLHYVALITMDWGILIHKIRVRAKLI